MTIAVRTLRARPVPARTSFSMKTRCSPPSGSLPPTQGPCVIPKGRRPQPVLLRAVNVGFLLESLQCSLQRCSVTTQKGTGKAVYLESGQPGNHCRVVTKYIECYLHTLDYITRITMLNCFLCIESFFTGWGFPGADGGCRAGGAARLRRLGPPRDGWARPCPVQLSLVLSGKRGQSSGSCGLLMKPGPWGDVPGPS